MLESFDSHQIFEGTQYNKYMPEVDIILPFHATRQYPAESYLQKCYEGLCATVPDFRLVLVDDACDETGRAVVESIARDRRNTLLIRSNYQRWFTRAVNLGLRMARTPRVVILNADTVLDAGWFEEIKQCWAEAEAQQARVGIVGSVLSDAEPRRWAFSTKPDYVTAHAVYVSVQSLYDVSAKRGTPGIYLDETSPLNIHIRSDVDLSWQLNAMGYAAVKSFKSRVGHHGGKSWGYNLARVQCLTLKEVSD